MKKNYFFVVIFLIFIFLTSSFILAVSSKNSDKFNVIVKYKANSKMHVSDSPVQELMTLEVNQKKYEELLNSNELESLQINKRVSAFLQNSTYIVNATLARSLRVNTINLTGFAQTVCIVDTGINYSHSALQANFLTGYCYCDNDGDYGTSDGCCPNGLNEDTNASDDEGHGTHVSGIVAASGGINGVAINSKIVMIKALDSSGSGWESDIIKGIDWCVNNASVLNISVISLSLGDTINYTGYCDSLNPFFSSSINAAVAKNISVVIATGNSGNSSGLSSPACIQNATPVGASNKTDGIASYSNRNSLVKLFAPGTNINSTYLTAVTSSGYYVDSGTSMAAPHVSGAIAIINQYLYATGRTRTPSQIESILNSTGKAIVDIGSGLTFYRINIYDALMSFNISSSISSPVNNSATNINISNFTCYSETGLNSKLVNVTFYIWNSTNSLLYNEIKNISGATNITIFNYTFSLESSYSWNCFAKNNISGSKFANSNNTFIFDVTKPNIALISPTAGYSTTSTSVTFSYNVTELNSIANCSLIINGAIDSTNLTIVNLSANHNFAKTFSTGSYSWNINCTDSAGNIANGSSRSITIEETSTPPSSGGGGGGGGGSSNVPQVYIPVESQLTSGYSKELKKDEKVKFKVSSGEEHSVKINNIKSGFVDVAIASNPFNVTLYIGFERKINVSSADYYDFSLLLNSVNDDKANITIKTINEKIISANLNGTRQLHENENNLTRDLLNNKISGYLLNNKLYIAGIALIVIVVIAFVLIKTKKNKVAINNIKSKSKKKKL